MTSYYQPLNGNTAKGQPAKWQGDNKVRSNLSINRGDKKGKLGRERNEKDDIFLELAPGIMIQGHVSDL